MDEQKQPEKPARRAVGGDLIIPLAAVAFTAYYVSTIIDSPWEAQANVFFVGSILVALVAILLVRLARAVLRGEADLGIGRLIEPRAVVPKRLALFGLALGYMVVIPWLGFTLTTFAFLAGAMLLLNEGQNKRLAFGLAALLALVGWLLFIIVFDTRFPAGPFERLVGLVL